MELQYYTIIEFLDIIHCLVFYLKHNVLETRFCLHLQVKDIQMVTESSLQNSVLNKK
jgi:hypothetical protein